MMGLKSRQARNVATGVCVLSAALLAPRAAAAAEMSAFKTAIGATGYEFRMKAPMNLLFVPLWVAFVWSVNRAASHHLGEGWVFLATLVAFFAVPILLGMAVSRIHRHLMDHYYEPSYGPSIKAKLQELRLKYPLAYI